MPPDALTALPVPRPAALGLSSDIIVPRHVTLHLLEEEGIVFDASRQSAYTLNATATFIWCSVENGTAVGDIVRQLEKTFALTPDCAAEYVKAALRSWRELGLVSDRPVSSAHGIALCGPEGRARPRRSGGPLPERAATARDYTLLDTTFRIRLAAPILCDEIDLLLRPLSGTAPVRDPVQLDLIEDGDCFSIVRDGRTFASCEQLNQAVPLIKTSLIELALRRSGDFGALHAAAVSRNGHCALLAGASGAGKSTLTAALVAAGFELLADDTTVLCRETLEARPVPFAICIKPGAWRLLESRFPEIGGRPVHHRLDGQKVRYLVPSAQHAWAKPTARRPVQSLIFLNRVPETTSSVMRIARADALSRFAKEFCPLGDGLTAAKMDELVRWILGIDCFELRYSPLDDGVEQLLRLCA